MRLCHVEPVAKMVEEDLPYMDYFSRSNPEPGPHLSPSKEVAKEPRMDANAMPI